MSRWAGMLLPPHTCYPTTLGSIKVSAPTHSALASPSERGAYGPALAQVRVERRAKPLWIIAAGSFTSPSCAVPPKVPAPGPASLLKREPIPHP